MRHPNIVEFLRAFSWEEHTYVVLELCPNGSLMEMTKTRGCLSLPEVRRYMMQLCGGVKYMHERQVIHRDLKMGNVFIDARMDLKIGDFGLAAVVLDDKERRQTLCGTPNYIAPEILNKASGKGHDHKVDTWALGIICYAMLTGGPPFASKTQQEIYDKLKELRYVWKADCKNYIPQEAKDLVSACLSLDATQRPDMDNLVSHAFFSMGVIASELDRSCRQIQPSWLRIEDPRGDRVLSDYIGDRYGESCMKYGVGLTASGRRIPSVGQNTKFSAMTEVELENRNGTAPVIPLPPGLLYKAFKDVQKDWEQTRSSVPRSRKPLLTNRVTSTSTYRQANLAADADRAAMPPPAAVPAMAGPRSHQSFAAQQRQQALPSRIVSRKIEPCSDLDGTTAVPSRVDTPSSPQGLLKARPLRSASSRAPRLHLTEEDILAPQKSEAISTATSTSRLRSVRSAQVLAENQSVKADRAPPQAQRPVRTTQRALRSAQTESTMNNVLQPITANDRQPLHQIVEHVSHAEHARTARKPSSRTRTRATVQKESSALEHLVPNTSSQSTLSTLRGLYDDLTPSGPRTNTDKSSVRPVKQSRPHVVVESWVDYAHKYGLGYILSGNIVGAVLRSSDDNSTPSSCVVVRGPQVKDHYNRRSKKLEEQLLTQKPGNNVEFYENSLSGIKATALSTQVFALDLSTHPDASQALKALGDSLATEDEKNADTELIDKLRAVMLLDRFGRYMTKNLGLDDEDLAAPPTPPDTTIPGVFVRFYQRIGNVGVWGYSDGGFQFNFPDHTKIVTYRDSEGSEDADRDRDLKMDLWYLQPADARSLATNVGFKDGALERRGQVTLNVSDVVASSSNALGGKQMKLKSAVEEVLKTNETREKLEWIRGVVGLWVRNGGLGCMGGEKLGWSGLRERDRKLVWITVGREGGDGADG